MKVKENTRNVTAKVKVVEDKVEDKNDEIIINFDGMTVSQTTISQVIHNFKSCVGRLEKAENEAIKRNLLKIRSNWRGISVVSSTNTESICRLLNRNGLLSDGDVKAVIRYMAWLRAFVS